MIIRRHNRRSVPGLNTAALPDLIFTVLFFFMIVTHMRTETKQVDYKMPKGSQLSEIGKKSSIINIYVGKQQHTKEADFAVQIDDKIVNVERIHEYIEQQRAALSPEDAEQMTVALKIDRHCPMAIVNQIKQQLRKAEALKISYNATSINDSI